MPPLSERAFGGGGKAAEAGGQTQTGRKVSSGVERAAHKPREGYVMAVTDLCSPGKLILAPAPAQR